MLTIKHIYISNWVYSSCLAASLCLHICFFFVCMNFALCGCARTRFVIEFEKCFAMALILIEGDASSQRTILA